MLVRTAANTPPVPLNRRTMLKSLSCGFGYLALSGLMAEAMGREQNPLAAKLPHFAPRAKRVIFMFMHGGPSQVDTFDYKPVLNRRSGQQAPLPEDPTLPERYRREPPRLTGSPWRFGRHGQSGLWISSLFPNVARHADDLCVLNGMHTEGRAHGEATLRFHTGSANFVRPSLGSWISYGLGTENDSLPSFITISPPRAHGGVQNYASAFLPAIHQGTALGTADMPVKDATLRYLENPEFAGDMQRRQLQFIQRLNAGHLEQAGVDAQLEGVIQAYELAFRMQAIAPEVLDLSRETAATHRQYGVGSEAVDDFGRQCLLARRFAEAGVRFIQISTGYKWDQHSDLIGGHNKIARAVDQPIAALLADLKARGLWDDTLILWGAEFGRTPFAEGADGRDHNPEGYTVWLSGGAVKCGMAYGGTDELGRQAVTGRVHYHDLHATILHLLGIDHERLTYRYSGRDFRLTDVYGRVVNEIIA